MAWWDVGRKERELEAAVEEGPEAVAAWLDRNPEYASRFAYPVRPQRAGLSPDERVGVGVATALLVAGGVAWWLWPSAPKTGGAP